MTPIEILNASMLSLFSLIYFSKCSMKLPAVSLEKPAKMSSSGSSLVLTT